MTDRCNRLSAGFTLVELMMVVAIIGVLASIAIPNYQRYQARSRQTEAKVALSSVYTAEQGFSAEYGTYTACVKRIGVSGDSVERRYYVFGFYLAHWNTTCGPTGGLPCSFYTFSGLTGVGCCAMGNSCPPGAGTAAQGENYFSETAQTNKHFITPSFPSDSSCPADDMSQNTFLAIACGNVSQQNVIDAWAINHNKTLVNVTPGI